MRVDYRKVLPTAVKAMTGLEEVVRSSRLEPELVELIKLRSSQINGCAYCLDMHSKDALARGEDQQRLLVLSAWRETAFYSERERAALGWCETLTTLSQSGASDEVFEAVARLFDDEEIVALTLAVVAINGWNRFAVGLQTPVGDYVSPVASAVPRPDPG
jgi:AhpD family alkylhydroperoxidase